MEELHYGDKNCSPPGKGGEQLNPSMQQLFKFSVLLFMSSYFMATSKQPALPFGRTGCLLYQYLSFCVISQPSLMAS